MKDAVFAHRLLHIANPWASVVIHAAGTVDLQLAHRKYVMQWTVQYERSSAMCTGRPTEIRRPHRAHRHT